MEKSITITNLKDVKKMTFVVPESNGCNAINTFGGSVRKVQEGVRHIRNCICENVNHNVRYKVK